MKLSPEERKERIKEYQREYYERNRGDRPRRILFPNLTEEERKERKREYNKRYSQNRTEEQKVDRREKRREYNKRRYQNMTEEQKNNTITPL